MYFLYAGLGKNTYEALKNYRNFYSIRNEGTKKILHEHTAPHEHKYIVAVYSGVV